MTQELATLTTSAESYIRQSKAAATLDAYQSDWAHFSQFTADRSLASLPASPETIAIYIAYLADSDKRVSTIERRLAAISKAHATGGLDSPCAMRHACVSETLKGIRRAIGKVQVAKAPAVTEYLTRMLQACPATLKGQRDRALLLLGFAGALRRSELVALNMADIEYVAEGIVVTIRRSKTDQDAEGRKVGIAYGSNEATCPVRSFTTWLAAASIESGPVFRRIDRHGNVHDRLTDQSVALLVKHYAEAAGLNPALFAGHSLRAGLATSAANAGANERDIMNQTGHRSERMMRRYIRTGTLFRSNVSAVVGL
jgi:site-specific recombinase XerD